MSQPMDYRRHRHRDYVDHSVDVLRQAGGRITKPRLAVIECLANSEQALSPAAVMDRIRKSPAPTDVDLATVYRNLEALETLGLVHRVGPNGEFVACGHAACKVELHLIVHCRRCDRTEELDVPEEMLGPVKRFIQKRTGYHFDEHFMQMSGSCRECAARG
jgi:Fur family ferric uptake transcriptional regulator